MECLVKRFMVMILREFGVNPPRIKVISFKVIEMDDIVMSDSEDSTVTYTAVSSPFRGLSDIGSPGVDGPPVMPEDPYVPESDPGEDPEEDDDEDPEEDPADYPTDRDDEDEEDEEPSGDEVDNKEEDDDEVEEEHPALSDSVPPTCTPCYG
ncbi:hypothetical protein Tco_0559456 [Tanacetum coccineum]